MGSELTICSRSNLVEVADELATVYNGEPGLRSPQRSSNCFQKWINSKFLLHGIIKMSKEAPVSPPTDEVREKYIFKIDRPDGPCYIAYVGGMPERNYTYVYLDRNGKFYFYASRTWNGSTYYVDVYDASVSKFTGPTPSIGREWFGQIQTDIRTVFQQRSFMNSGEAIPKGEHFGNLTFSWGIK